MTRVRTMIALVSLVLAAMQASAGNSIVRPPMTKHQVDAQITACMKKWMYADRAVSYNEAASECKNQIARKIDASASGALVAPDTPSKCSAHEALNYVTVRVP